MPELKSYLAAMRLYRFYILGLIFVSCGLLFACHRNAPKFTIGVSQCSDDEWRHQMNNEMVREANFYENVEVKILTSKDSSEQQVDDIRRLISEEVDLLVVAPNETTPITPVVEEAYAKGIPVIIVDRKILSDHYTAYVGADNFAIGHAVGEYIINLLQGTGKVVEITGLKGSTSAVERHEGFVHALSKATGVELIAVAEGEWHRGRAKAVMDSLLQQHVDFDVVFAQNDRMADGAYEAALIRNRDKQIKFVGIDALPGEGYGLESVLAGKLDATFIYPTGGDKVMQLAMNILQNQPFERETVLGTSVVDATNAPVMKLQTSHIRVLDHKIEMLGGKMNEYLVRFATQQVVIYGSLLVLVLVVGLLVAVYLSLRTKNRLNKELFYQKNKLEKQKNQLQEQKEKLEQLSRELEAATHAKLVFFTNVSHDFRTPLTLIADPIDQLLADTSISLSSRQLLELMKKNVHILLRLVNQILDFRKVENGRMDLNLSLFDLKENFRNWNDSFKMALLKKHIDFRFEVAQNVNFQLMADEAKMECIYFNLFSNAVKYTPENGHILIKMTEEEGKCELTVFNTGSRIADSDVEAIFERFYQVNGHKAGTGIGLALVRAFVEMHGGDIHAYSDNNGTYFIVHFPLQVVYGDSLQPLVVANIEQEVSAELVDAELTDISEDTLDSDASTVLVIDDNADIRTYIKSFLSKDYRVLLADNGSHGLQLAMKYIPDVVVSDVMMPVMDGVECCRRLKNEIQTSHIPVILLTACSLDEQRIQGYDGGADSYISKPFNSQLLISRIRNLIENRKQLRQFFSDSQNNEKESISALDKDFVSRFKELIEERFHDSELTVEDLGREMGMSRVQLYRKLKSLTNYSPNELLRQIRLKKAALLLATSEMTVAEIAYEVGFSAPSYFAKCYKEQYGESPTDFLKRTKGL